MFLERYPKPNQAFHVLASLRWPRFDSHRNSEVLSERTSGIKVLQRFQKSLVKCDEVVRQSAPTTSKLCSREKHVKTTKHNVKFAEPSAAATPLAACETALASLLQQCDWFSWSKICTPGPPACIREGRNSPGPFKRGGCTKKFRGNPTV